MKCLICDERAKKEKIGECFSDCFEIIHTFKGKEVFRVNFPFTCGLCGKTFEMRFYPTKDKSKMGCVYSRDFIDYFDHENKCWDLHDKNFINRLSKIKLFKEK